MHTSWISALATGGFAWAYAESGKDTGQYNDALKFGSLAAATLSFITLYVSINKTISAQEAAQSELAASIEKFASEHGPEGEVP
jgi:hypothetical protein